MFRNLVGAGQDFVHSDADAIWLRDPVEDWMSTDTDMIFSQGTIHPSDAHAAVGFVLCCGLFRINATAASARFLDLVAEHVVSTGDDQYSVNEVLRTNGAAWDKATVPDYRLRMRGKPFSCWKNPIEGECAQLGLRVALIPHSVVQRIHDPIDTNGRVCVKHLLTPKKAGEKLDRLRREGLLFIREDWRELPPQASFKDYLAPQG